MPRQIPTQVMRAGPKSELQQFGIFRRRIVAFTPRTGNPAMFSKITPPIFGLAVP